MPDKRINQKPSKTAFFNVLHRALAHKFYKNPPFGPDSLAQYFLPPHYRFFLRFKSIQNNTKEKLNRFFPGLHEYIIARTAYFDELFVRALNNHTPQIVLLGAGYDTRAYRFAALNENTKIYELDSPHTQNSKISCLKRAKIAIPKQVNFVPIDFIKDSLLEVLETAGFQNQHKTLFIWEGVSYYLDRESIENTLTFFNQFTQKDSTLAFDYIISAPEADLGEYYGVKEFLQTMKDYHADEELMFSIGKGEIESFLTARNLSLVEHMDTETIESAYLVDNSGDLLGPITALFRFVLAAHPPNSAVHSPRYYRRDRRSAQASAGSR